MKYELAIFDLDGTILDTIADLTTAVNDGLAKEGLPLRPVDDIRRFVGNGIHKTIERAVQPGTDAAAIERIYDNFNAYYPEHCADLTRPYPGIRELVERLRAAGVKTAVVSNKVDYGVKKLCDLWYPGLFDMALGERPGIPRKPAPDGVLEVLSALGVPAERSVYIGDSDVDLQTARNAGMDEILVAWGFRGRKALEDCGGRRIVDTAEEIGDLILGN